MLSKRKLFRITIALIGIHSLLLGIFIFFKTGLFYRIFFNAEISNLFFVKQSGLFLFLSGLFYLFPLINSKKMCDISVLIILSKTLAVVFLISYAGLAPGSKMIYWAAILDGLMAALLTITYLMFKKEAR